MLYINSCSLSSVSSPGLHSELWKWCECTCQDSTAGVTSVENYSAAPNIYVINLCPLTAPDWALIGCTCQLVNAWTRMSVLPLEDKCYFNRVLRIIHALWVFRLQRVAKDGRQGGQLRGADDCHPGVHCRSAGGGRGLGRGSKGAQPTDSCMYRLCRCSPVLCFRMLYTVL